MIVQHHAVPYIIKQFLQQIIMQDHHENTRGKLGEYYMGEIQINTGYIINNPRYNKINNVKRKVNLGL